MKRIEWFKRTPLLLLPLLIGLFFNKMAFSNLILARGDTFLYFYPYWSAAAEALQNGRVPLWNPNLFMGAPFLANSQVGFFYPLNWPVWLLLETPYAVSASILLHLLIAGVGAYLAGRNTLGLGRWAGLVTAVLFALGGYLTAQVEHINQLQGLAWMPWFLWVAASVFRSRTGNRWALVGRGAAGFALLFSLQLLAGHTQTSFITGVMLLIWGAAHGAEAWLLRESANGLVLSFQWRRFYRRLPLVLVVGGGVAILLTAVQLLPTYELSQLSSRQGGLTPNEVLSFSLHPLLLNRALLPAYGQSLFSEYVAILPLTALLLAFLAAWQWRNWRGVLPALALVLFGLFLALGIFNPFNWLLARLPVFNLFRVPARWLAMYGLGVALLAGLGWQMVLDRWLVGQRGWRDLPMRAKENLWHLERPFRVGIWVLVGLIGWNVVANFASFFISTGPEAPFEMASVGTLLLWLGELLLLFAIIMGQRLTFDRETRFKIGFRVSQPAPPWLLLLLMSVLLFWGTRSHPYNNLTTPEAYFDLRPPLARLLAADPCLDSEACATPSGRFLSLSDIFFDVGDQGEIDTIYGDQLTLAAQYDYTIAIKQKEIVGPNLPMIFGLAAVDGFDGGVLPLNSYSQFVQLALPPDRFVTDGRLREQLTAVPPAAWLDLVNNRYIITDKVGDSWQEVGSGLTAFFDLEFPITLGAGESLEIAYTPSFTATALALIADGNLGKVEAITQADERWEITPVAQENGTLRADWPAAQEAAVARLTLHGPEQGRWQIAGATLINVAQESFQPLVLGNYRLIHSGDVKIYENLDVLPRAFLLPSWTWQPDSDAVLVAMQQPDFVVGETAVLLGSGESHQGVLDNESTATITQYTPERIVIETSQSDEALLLLSDVFYPGWQVTVDGQAADLLQADGLFRGVLVGAGTHEVVFTFAPESYRLGLLITAVGFGLLMLLRVVLLALQRFE